MVSGQTLPPAASTYHRQQQLEMGAATAAVSRQWRRMDVRDIDRSWQRVGPLLLAVVTTGQRRITGRVPGYISSVLRQTGQARWDNPFAETLPLSLLGVAGDGRPVGTLLELAPIQVKTLIREGMPPEMALRSVDTWLDTATTNVLADTARATEKVEMSVRGIEWYVRIVNAGACSRCVILAGREYKMAVAFDRHDKCRCEHIPVGQRSEFSDWQMDPQEYFDSLSGPEQERIFTKAGAEAIRAGADPSLVVNARRGMTTAQQNIRGWIPKGRLAPTTEFGQQVYLTTESTTRFGSASQARTGRRSRTRLMPESIISIAEDQDDLRRLLRLNGYIR